MVNFIKYTVYVVLVLVLMPISISIAANGDADDIESLREKLQSVKQQTQDQAEQLAQSRASKKKLEMLVECSWKLLKGYEDCESEFDKTSNSYLSCVNKAKSANQQCTQEANDAFQ